MATAYRGFQLGLLPERKINKRALATSYGLVALVLLIVINLGLLLPEKLQLAAISRYRTYSYAFVAARAGAHQSQARGASRSCFPR